MAGTVLTWKILRIFQNWFLSGKLCPKHATTHIHQRWQQLKQTNEERNQNNIRGRSIQ